MRVLFVEDTPNKRRDIANFYNDAFPDDELILADSLISGLRAARDNRPEFILLDMTLPNYSDSGGGGANEVRPFAGREFIVRVRRMRFRTCILIVSMFETFGHAPDLITLESMDADFKSSFPDVYAGAVFYSPSTSSWQHQIEEQRRKVS